MVDFSPQLRLRKRVEQEIGQGVLVLFAAAPTLRNNDVTHEFRQDSDFYFSLDAPEAAARYRGIGVRIEDDVLIEAKGARVLSPGVPREADEVERACRS